MYVVVAHVPLETKTYVEKKNELGRRRQCGQLLRRDMNQIFYLPCSNYILSTYSVVDFGAKVGGVAVPSFC